MGSPDTRHNAGERESRPVISFVPTRLNDLVVDVLISSPSSDEVLAFDGSKWVNAPVPPPDLSAYARKDQANTFTTGTQTVQTGAAATVGLVVKGAASQTASLIEARDSSDAVVFGVSADGRTITTPTRIAIGSSASATGNQSTAIGLGASSGGVDGIAVGPLATAAGDFSIALGLSASASVSNGIAIGALALCNQAASAAIGSGQTLASNEMAWGCINGLGAVANVRLTGHSDVQPRSMSQIVNTWVSSVDATRTVRTQFLVNDAANPTTGREYLRGETDGSNALIGFLGASAIARPTVTGSRGGNAALASLLTALANLGLVTDSTTA